MSSFPFIRSIADDVICRLDQGLLDFGVLIEPVDITRYQFLELPKKDRWTALLPKAHPLAQKEALTPKDLSEMYPLYWTPSKEGTFCVIRLNLS